MSSEGDNESNANFVNDPDGELCPTMEMRSLPQSFCCSYNLSRLKSVSSDAADEGNSNLVVCFFTTLAGVPDGQVCPAMFQCCSVVITSCQVIQVEICV